MQRMLRQARDRIVPRRLRASRSLSASLASIARHRSEQLRPVAPAEG